MQYLYHVQIIPLLCSVICYFSFTLSCMLSTFQVLTHTCTTSSRDIGLSSQHLITLRSVPDFQFSRISDESSFSEDNNPEFIFFLSNFFWSPHSQLACTVVTDRCAAHLGSSQDQSRPKKNQAQWWVLALVILSPFVIPWVGCESSLSFQWRNNPQKQHKM